MTSKGFHKYRYILAIDLGYSFKNGTAVAIFDKETHLLIVCGILRPFAPGLDDHRATIEMAAKVKEFWVIHIGFSWDPEILCIEYPQNCFVKNGFTVNAKNIIMLGILGARIEGLFSPKKPLRPSPNQWKGNASKEQTQEYVLNNLCVWSKKNLERDLVSIPKNLHHNVYDAIGLGLWAIKNKDSDEK